MGTRRRHTEIFSIFGQCEAAASQLMIDRGDITKIEQKDIPPTALYNERGQLAYFAVVVPSDKLSEFNRRCEEMRL